MSVEALNNQDRWTSNEPSPMSQADIGRFQDGLNSILGVEDDSTPRMRLVWGADLRNTMHWDRYRREWVPRYAHKMLSEQVLNPATGLYEAKIKWIGVPRFFIEAFIPRAHAKPDEERAGVDADGDVYAEARNVSGMWMMATPIYEHSHLTTQEGWRTCCYDAVLRNQKCWGTYREPDEKDLETVKQGLEYRLARKYSRPDQPLNQYDRAQAYYEWMLEDLRTRNQKMREIEYNRRHTMGTLKHWVDGVPSKKGRFSFLSE